MAWRKLLSMRSVPAQRLCHCRFLKIPGISYDGGYAAHVIAPVEALAHIPDTFRPEEAGPLMCAGVTTFNALRHSGAGPGDIVGYPGHRRTLAFGRPVRSEVRLRRSRHRTREESRRWRWSSARGDTSTAADDVAAELNKEGGAAVILVTAPDPKAMGALVDGLGCAADWLSSGQVLIRSQSRRCN